MVHLKEVKRTAIKQNMHQKMSTNVTKKNRKEIMQISTYVIKTISIYSSSHATKHLQLSIYMYKV